MDQDNPPRKKRWGWLKKSRSDPHLAQAERVARVASQTNPSSLSSSRTESRRRSSGLIRELWDRIFKSRSTRSARRTLNPEPAAVSASARDIPHPQTSQDSSPLTTPAPVQNPDQSSNLSVAKVEQLDPRIVNERIADATKGVAGIGHVPGIVQSTYTATNDLQSVSDAIDTLSPLIGPLKVFNSIVNGLADLHPYAKVALSIFTYASKMILDQADRDVAISRLLLKISQVYTFITEKEELAKIESMLAVYGMIAQQTLDCADFIAHYSETKSAWIRLGKHVVDETDATIQSYSVALDGLMQQFRDQATRDAVIILHRAGEDLDFNGMAYSDGASFDTSRRCLPGTREIILSEIKSWILSTGEDVQRVLWLSGTAGKGKSAIAHTIANWSNEQGGLGAFFCFDRTHGADHRYEKIFTTIARDLADCHPTMRRALARAVHDRNELRHTIDISRQWQELIVKPINEASKAITAPVLIVIDALDESGDSKSRERILRLLAGNSNASSSQPSQLPPNFRIIITSRPLEDIEDALHNASHVRRISMDDIPVESTELDIELYISTKLRESPRNSFDNGHFKTLARKADGLFEWARLACEYIQGTNTVRRNPMSRFEAVVATTSAKGTHLLDDMYVRILADSMPEKGRGEAMPIFCSVMGQILASSEPLSMAALTAMRLDFPRADDRYDVEDVIRSLGSLVTGTTDPQTSIRPLHTSFYDFLTDKSRSCDFFVDVSSVQSDLAFASLRVMECGLRFNICSLESSYLPNSAVSDLEKRVKQSIPAELSYACRFWGTHVAATSFEPSLAKGVEAFFDGERLLWWLEALSLMKNLSGSVGTLSSIASWVTGHNEYTHVSDAARDIQRFVRTFGAIILHSTPHIYLSALPFSPTQSIVSKQFAAKFSRIPRITAGHVVKWPQMEKILHLRSEVYSLAMSQDGKRIVCGLEDGSIQLWDMETGEASGAPLKGHTECVAAVVFSPDGHRVASGSDDNTVRVWDVRTGKALGAPLQGHTKCVTSVAISPDGKRIVSGSDDNTVWVWDMGTGKALGTPLQGHTESVTSVAISSDGKCLVSGSDDNTTRVWDMETGEAIGAPLQGHTDCVCSVAMSQDGKFIVSGSEDNTIRVWDMKTGQELVPPLQGHTGAVLSVTISSDGNHIVSGSFDQTIRVWDAKTGKTLGSPLQGHTNSVVSVAISPDGNRIVSGSYDMTIRVWDVNATTGEALSAALQGHAGSVNSVAISPNGDRIVSGSSDQTIRVWDMKTGEAQGVPLQGHADWVRTVAISPDGNRIVSGSDDATIQVWDMEMGKALGDPIRGHSDAVRALVISPDGNRIVSGSDDKTIQVWDMGTGKALGAPLSGHSDWVQSIAISPDGNHIVSGSDDKTIQVWDVGAGTARGAPLLGHSDFICSVAISPDGNRIVSSSDDKTIQMWDMVTGKALDAPLQGHTESVTSVAISPDGRHIVSGSYDKIIRVWDMGTREVVGAPFRGHTGPIWSVSISPDGKYIVSGSDDNSIRVWDLEDFLNRDQTFEAPAICFSSDPNHALHSASSFLQGSETPAPSGPTEEGWVVGPEGRLLLWIPPTLHPATYARDNALVIPNNALQLDLSCVAHGTAWHECRNQPEKAAI